MIKLICHSRDDTKLTLHLRDRPEEDLKFSQARERHDFCLLVFEMKKSLPETFESKTLSVYVGSFNMGKSFVHCLFFHTRCALLAVAARTHLRLLVED